MTPLADRSSTQTRFVRLDPFSLTATLKSRDAVLLFYWFYSNTDSDSLFFDSWESLTSRIDGANLTSSRGNRFTSETIRRRLSELKEAQLIDVQSIRPSALSIRLLCRLDGWTSKKPDQEGHVSEKRTTTSDLRSFVDFARPDVATLRREIARRIWEPSVNPELIDRIVGLIVLNLDGWNKERAYALIRQAVNNRELYRRTNGRYGCEYLWETLGRKVKRSYQASGWVWVPTKIETEPKPADFGSSIV